MRRVLVVDERATERDRLLTDLRDAGLDVSATFDVGAVDAIVVAVDALSERGLPACALSEPAQRVPVIVVAAGADPETRLRAVIDGAVQCMTTRVEASAVGDAVARALAADAPSLHEQRRRARVAALEALARVDAQSPVSEDDARCRVHLTRLEHGPVRTMAAGNILPLEECSAKQRELLALIVAQGSVASAALVLGASRSSVYASLRRIAHRLKLRDTAELLHMIDTGALPRPTMST